MHTNTGCVSESGDFAKLFFWFGNSESDAAIAIFLPTLKHFSCTGAVDCSTTSFCCESVLQKRWQFCDRSAWISKIVRDSSQSSCTISPCHQDLLCSGRSEDLCVKSVERWLQTTRVTQSSDAQNGVDPFNGASHYRNILGFTYCFYTTTFLL